MNRWFPVGAALFAVVLVAPAHAADVGNRMVTKAPAYVGPSYNWTGLYVGGHIGYGWGDRDWTFPATGVAASHDISGFLGGGQLGYNYQVGSTVLGVEGDISWTNADGSSICGVNACASKLDWISTVTGRLGYTWGPGLLYAKGGGAFARDHYDLSLGGANVGTASQTKSGWTVGLGLEYMLAPNWTAKAEYNYVDLGTNSTALSNGTPVDVDQKAHLLKFGVNYKFNWDAPLARR